MHALIWPVMVILFGGLGFSQGVRSLGMAGLVLPGPGAAHLNPAYAAFPAEFYGSDPGFRLPIGVLGLVLRPESNPLPGLSSLSHPAGENSPFDLLTFYDQFSRPFEILINPASSRAFVNPATGYPEIQINVDATGIQITDYQGNPIQLELWLGTPTGLAQIKAITPGSLFRVPFWLGPSLYLDVGPFAGGFGLGLFPNENLRQALRTGRLQPNTEYALSLSGSAKAGISVGLGYATRLPDLPIPQVGTASLFVGTRAEAFYGVAYLEGSLSRAVQTNAQGQFDPNQPPVYRGTVFYTLPNNGSGFGARADFGVALEFQGTTVGLGIRNALGFARWSGTELSWDGTASSPVTTQSERSSLGFVPAFFLNASTHIPLEVGALIIGGDLGYEASLFGHLGGEYSLGPARLRAGVGFENGLRFGLGAGFVGPGFTIDTALTAHRAPIVGHTVFGIGLSLGLGF